MNMRPLCVDLDHTLFNTDVSIEALLELLKKNPLKIFAIVKMVITGKRDELKDLLSTEVNLDWEKLPVNLEVLNFIKQEHQNGRKIYLVTGTHHVFAQRIHKIYPFFESATGTITGRNLIGLSKADYLEKFFGKGEFDYIGDSKHDLHVWEKCNDAYVVSRNKKFIKKVKNLKEVFHTDRNAFKFIMQAIRANQWVKNFLLFLPLILAHQFRDLELLAKTAIGFMSFSLIASSIYLLNDIFDIQHDRVHRLKQFRAIPSGNLELFTALQIVIVFIIISFLLAFNLDLTFGFIILLYFLTNLAYSSKLKKLAIIDVFLLSGFYLIRIWGGGEIGDIVLSPWLKSFSFFLFLSLGFLKRYSEVILSYQKSGQSTVAGRAYVYQDSNILLMYGVASAYLSVMVLSMYIYQGQMTKFYPNVNFMWAIVLLMTYWISSLWFRATHARVKEDPVKFIIQDKESLVILGIATFCFFSAMYL